MADDSPVFVDTNTLVFHRLSGSPFHAHASAALVRLIDANVELWISRQILREYIAVMTRGGTVVPPIPIQVILEDVEQFSITLRIVEDTPEVFTRLVRLLAEIPCGGKQIHDANIVATMLTAGISRLLTHNIDDFKRFEGHVELLPN